MKKKLFALLPFLALVGCSAQPLQELSEYLVTYENGLPVISNRDNPSSHVTYLMMSPFGYLDIDDVPVKGEVSELFYENTIVWKFDAGEPLPAPAKVKTTVSGATFRGWAYYDEENDHVWPDYFTTVPDQDGLALKAIFDGTDAGGNTSGGGSSSGGSSGSTSQTGFGIKYGDGTIVMGVSKGTNFEGFDEYLVSKASFKKDDTFSLYDPSTLGTWSVPLNPYSFGAGGDESKVAEYVTKRETDYVVNKDFKADLYIQILYQQDRLYIELVA